jgi:hypothetical protein
VRGWRKDPAMGRPAKSGHVWRGGGASRVVVASAESRSILTRHAIVPVGVANHSDIRSAPPHDAELSPSLPQIPLSSGLAGGSSSAIVRLRSGNKVLDALRKDMIT